MFYGNIVVNSGVTIGEGRIIDSSSVITKDIWDWSEKVYRVIEESTD